jgi:hypothetical protein
LHQIMYQFFDCKICFSFLSSVWPFTSTTVLIHNDEGLFSSA